MVKKLVSYDTDTGELSTDVEADLAQRFGEKLSKADADATYVRPTDLADLGGGVNPRDAGYDLVIIAGQSNAAGQATGFDVARIDVSDPRIFSYDYTGTYANTIALAQDPLRHQSGGNYAGPGMTFARWYVNAIPANRKVLLVPVAFPGTGFSADTDGTWKVADGVLYANAIAQSQAALTAAGPNARITAILWVQGEHDTDTHTQAQYAADLDQLIDGFRALPTASEAAFVVGQMVPEFIAGLGGKSAANAGRINAAHIDTPRRKTRTGFGYGVSGAANADNLHYNIAGQRYLGRSMYDAYLLAKANVTGSAPLPPPAVTATAAGVVSWTRPYCRFTDFTVQYRAQGAGTWTTWTHTASLHNVATLTGLTADTTYEVRVATVNEQGTSDWSPTATFTVSGNPAQAPGQVTGLTAGAATGSTQALTWTAVPGATSYNVEYKTAASGTWLTFGTVTNASATVTGLTSGTSYNYRVSAVNSAGTGPVSATVTASTTAPTPTVADDFNRADGALGTTSVGEKTWAGTGASVMSIVGNQVKVTSGSGIGAALVPVDSPDGTFKATLKAVSGTPSTMISGVAFRATNDASCLMVALRSSPTAAEYTLASRSGGTTTTVAASGVVPAANDVVEAVLSGDSIVVKVNGNAIITQTVATFNTVAKGGFYHHGSDTVTAWDDFSYTPA